MDKRTCLICERPARTRGLCGPHFSGIAYHAKYGRFAWDELVEHGKALPARDSLDWATARDSR